MNLTFQPHQVQQFSNEPYVIYNEFSTKSDTLSKYIACYWHLRTTKLLTKKFEYLIIPDACIDLVLDLKNPKAFVSAPFTEQTAILLETSFEYFGARFLPGFGTKFLGIKTVSKTESFRKIEQANGVDLGGTTKNVAEDMNNETRIEILDELFVKIFSSTQSSINKRAVDIIQELLQDKAKVSDIARVHKISERHLRRIVKKESGFTPKQLQKISRFQSTITNPDSNTSYYDQSHLVKNYKTMTNKSPKVFHHLHKI